MRRDRLTFAHDGRHADHAADAVRLRHQRRSEAPADGACSTPTTARSRAALVAALREHAATSGSSRAACDARREADAAARARRRAVRASTIPADFSRALVRGERPALLLEADATDPAATGNALGRAAPASPTRALGARPRPARWPRCAPRRAAVRDRASSAATTPRASRATTSCPGLIGVILTMTW